MADATIEALRAVLSVRKKKSVNDSSLSPAAVLLLLYPKNGEHCILLNKRTDEVEYHKGEISFPGGGKDPEDRDFLETALREANEEMGIRPEDVDVLGQLDDVTTQSGFGVRVFVGTIPYPYPFIPNPIEIAEVLEVPVSDLLDPANIRTETRRVDGKTAQAAFYAYGEHLIFGATSRIVTQFLDLLLRETTAGYGEGEAID